MNTQSASEDAASRPSMLEWDDAIQRRRITLLNRLLLSGVVLGFAAMVLLFVALKPTLTSESRADIRGANAAERMTALLPLIVGWLAMLIAWGWRSIRHRTRTLTLVVIVCIVGIFLSVWGGSPGRGGVWLLLIPSLAYILLGQRSIIVSGAASVLIYTLLSLTVSQEWVVLPTAGDLDILASPLIGWVSFLFTAVALTLVLWSFHRSWSKALAGAGETNTRLQAQTQDFRERIARLERRTSQLQATADIAHVGSSILDPENLMTQLVNRIQEGFGQSGVYYVGLFLLKEAQQTAVLRAATGEAGQLLLEMAYKLDVDETSTIGRCIIHRQARIARDAGEGTLRFDALPMPHARSEIALPLRSRGRILGALSMLGTKTEAFSEADIAALQTMADQVALAIDNAVLFSQTKTSLEHLRAVQQRYVAQTWDEFLATRPVIPIDYTEAGTEPGDTRFLRDARRAAMVHGRTVATTSPPSDDGSDIKPQAALVVPLQLRGQIIGTIALHETGHPRPWTVEEIALAETVAEQVTLTVENLRLMEETQRRAAYQEKISDVTTSIRETLDTETVLKTAVQKVRQTMGLSEVEIRLAVEDTESTTPTG